MNDIVKLIRMDITGAERNYKISFMIAILVLVPVIYALMPIMAIWFVILFTAIMGNASETHGKSISKLYGILPVSRKNIYREKIYIIYFSGLAGQLLGYALTLTSLKAKVIRYIPFDTDIRMMLDDMFNEGERIQFMILFYAFMTTTLLISLKRMMTLILGKEVSTRITMIILLVPCALVIIFMILNGFDLLPVIDISEWAANMRNDLSAKDILTCVIGNIAAAGICAAFAEITASKMKDRDL